MSEKKHHCADCRYSKWTSAYLYCDNEKSPNYYKGAKVVIGNCAQFRERSKEKLVVDITGMVKKQASFATLSLPERTKVRENASSELEIAKKISQKISDLLKEDDSYLNEYFLKIKETELEKLSEILLEKSVQIYKAARMLRSESQQDSKAENKEKVKVRIEWEHKGEKK